MSQGTLVRRGKGCARDRVCVGCGGRVAAINTTGYCAAKIDCRRHGQRIRMAAYRERNPELSVRDMSPEMADQERTWRRLYSRTPAQICRRAYDRAWELTPDTDITVDHLLSIYTGFCANPVCGVELQPGRDTHGDLSPSIDKIIPAKGYRIGNVAWLCLRCNRIKSDASSAELRGLADWIDSTQKGNAS